MKTKDLNKYVAEQFAQGKTERQIAMSLGISVECMYRKMAADDDEKPERKEDRK